MSYLSYERESPPSKLCINGTFFVVHFSGMFLCIMKIKPKVSLGGAVTLGHMLMPAPAFRLHGGSVKPLAPFSHILQISFRCRTSLVRPISTVFFRPILLLPAHLHLCSTGVTIKRYAQNWKHSKYTLKRCQLKRINNLTVPYASFDSSTT